MTGCCWGFQGYVSEMERDDLVHRMVEARWNKARRGEAFTLPPAGYDLDDEQRWVLSLDEAVQHAVRRVFSKFDELGSARQVFLWWREQGGLFPVRRVEELGHPIVWLPVQYRHVYQMLGPSDLCGSVRSSDARRRSERWMPRPSGW